MSILTEPVPVYATMITGATGLVVGALFARQVARDKIAMARRLHTLAVRYEAEADQAYAKTRALTEPTQSVPVIELIPPSRSQRMHLAVTEAIERITARDAQLPMGGRRRQRRSRAPDHETVPPPLCRAGCLADVSAPKATMSSCPHGCATGVPGSWTVSTAPYGCRSDSA
jgi:hypothetical protein